MTNCAHWRTQVNIAAVGSEVLCVLEQASFNLDLGMKVVVSRAGTTDVNGIGDSSGGWSHELEFTQEDEDISWICVDRKPLPPKHRIISVTPSRGGGQLRGTLKTSSSKRCISNPRIENLPCAF